MRTYWAAKGKTILGPFDTLEQAIEAGYATFNLSAYRAAFMTGYGLDRPYFDLRFHTKRVKE